MNVSLRDHVSDLLRRYADLVHKYFQALNTVAENSSQDNAPSPEELVKDILDTDTQLQAALEQSTLLTGPLCL